MPRTKLPSQEAAKKTLTLTLISIKCVFPSRGLSGAPKALMELFPAGVTGPGVIPGTIISSRGAVFPVLGAVPAEFTEAMEAQDWFDRITCVGVDELCIKVNGQLVFPKHWVMRKFRSNSVKKIDAAGNLTGPIKIEVLGHSGNRDEHLAEVRLDERTPPQHYAAHLINRFYCSYYLLEYRVELASVPRPNPAWR